MNHIQISFAKITNYEAAGREVTVVQKSYQADTQMLQNHIS
jgi:hypothetical protein